MPKVKTEPSSYFSLSFYGRPPGAPVKFKEVLGPSVNFSKACLIYYVCLITEARPQRPSIPFCFQIEEKCSGPHPEFENCNLCCLNFSNKCCPSDITDHDM